MSSVMHATSRLGVATRRGDPHEIQAAREALNAAKVQRAIEQGLAEAPPLTPEDRERLASLLLGSGHLE